MSVSIHDASPLQLAAHMKRRQRIARIAARAIAPGPLVQKAIREATWKAAPEAFPEQPIQLVEVSPCPAMWLQLAAGLDPEGLPPERPAILSIEIIKRAVARDYGVTCMDIVSNRRTANIVRPRQVTCYLAKTMTLRSLPEIGRRLGKRDHTTVLHAVRKIERLITADPVLAARVEAIRLTIAGVQQ